MIPLLRGCLVPCILTLLAVGTVLALDPPGPAPSPARPTTPREEPNQPAKADQAGRRLPLDKLKLPPSAIIVICDEVKDPQRLFPNMVIMTPERFKEMNDRIQQLERQLKPGKGTPKTCKLTGRVEGDFAYLQADFKIATEQQRDLVALGCQDTFLTDADLDGQWPLLSYGEDGYVVEVSKPGEHQLTLHLKMPVAVQRAETLAGGTEHSFELGLPGAPATSLTLELPKTVKELRWKEPRWSSWVQANSGKNGTCEITVGVIRRLKLSWREPVTLPEAAALPAARWQTTVKVNEQHVLTTAGLILSDPRARTREWRIFTPPEADLKVLNADTAPYEVVVSDNRSTFVIKGPPAEQLEVQIALRSPRPFTRLPVGPFFVAGVERQEGTIDVYAAPEALRPFRLVYHRLGEIRQQEVPQKAAGSDLLARFQYWLVPEPGKGPRLSRPPRQAPLEIELKPVAALVKTSVEHLLRLRPAEQGWQVAVETKIHVTPLHNGTDFLEVQLPRGRPAALPVLALLAGSSQASFPQNALDAALLLQLSDFWPVQVLADYEYDRDVGPPADFQILPGQRKARITLERSQMQKFSVSLKCTWLVRENLLPGKAGQARLELPRPLTFLDNGGKVTVEADEHLELLAPGPEAEAVPGRQRVTLVEDRAPAAVDLAWRPYQPEFPATILADVDLPKGHVRQELKLHFPERQGAGQADPGLRPLNLRVPPQVAGLAVVRGGRLFSFDGKRARLEVSALDPLILEYDFALPARVGAAGHGDRQGANRPAPRLVQVPLFWPEGATQARTRVRLWSEPGTMPALPEADLAGEPWKDHGAEIVAGRDSLPSLVLQGDGLGVLRVPLALRLFGSSLSPSASVLVDDALIQVEVKEDGARLYRACYLLTRLNAHHLDVEFPAALTRLGKPRFLLDGKQLPSAELTPGGHLARLQVNPALYKRPVVLSLSYQLPPGVPETDGFCQTTLHPPVLHGDVFLSRVRWRLTLPHGLTALPPGGYASVGQHWGWHGWLLAPEPVERERDLELWVRGGTEPGEAPPAASLIFWADSLEPVTVLYVPQQGWLPLCSGVLLLLSLGLLLAPVSRWLFWALVGLLVLAAVAAGLTWPDLLPTVLYGCEPGAAVLLILLTVQWLLHQRYRRQVVFMPAFTRLKPGSAPGRGSSVNRRPHETSTVDGPAAGPSSGNQGSGSAKDVAT